MSLILVDVAIIDSSVKQNRGYHKGRIYTLSDTKYQTLSKLPLGEKRVQFVKGLTLYNDVEYNIEKNICFMPQNIPLQDNLFSLFTESTLFAIYIPLSEPIQPSIFNFSFNHPYITNTLPFEPELGSTKYVVLTRDTKQPCNSTEILNMIDALIEAEKQESCQIRVKLTLEAIEFLRKASRMGTSLTHTQKEIAGELQVKFVENNVVNVGLVQGSISVGEEESIRVAASRFNFHSHPNEAYVKYNISVAWPSNTDYLGYLKLGQETIMHCVAGNEGLYVISFTPYWGEKLKEVKHSFVKKAYDFPYNLGYTPYVYIRKINKILYKNHPIFEVKFFEWENIPEFEIYFPRIEKICILTDEINKNYKKIASK